MGFLEDIKKKILIFDGSKGYMLQEEGLPAGASPEQFNVTHPEILLKIHKAYVDAGCDVIQTNTFTGNRVMLEKHGLAEDFEKINTGGTELAIKAAGGKAYVAASIGPTGLMFEPFGELDFDKAYDIFREQVAAVDKGGADIINFETFTDIAEMKAALFAAKESTDLPVICSMAFERNKHTLMGTDPLTCARILLASGADMVGANCSFGPGHMVDIIKDMAKTGTYLSVKPNAGMPKIEEGVTVYEQCPADFAAESVPYGGLNVRLAGGCCGTTPGFIGALRESMILKPYTGEVESGEFICSTLNSINVEDDFSIGIYRVEDDMEIDDIIEDLYDITDENDVVELYFSGNDAKMPVRVIRATGKYLIKPVIFSCAYTNALKYEILTFPGVGGVREPELVEHGAVLIRK